MSALVTGSSGGIGRAIAEIFLERGHQVDGLDVREAPFEREGYRHHVADVRDAAALPQLPAPAVIVNCAGVQDTADDIDVNLKGTINVCERYGFVSMSQPTPELLSIVNVGSSSGHNGSEFPQYAASKGGVIAYTRNLALRVAPQAIANSVDPGGVLTELNRPVMEDEALWSRIMSLTPLRRWATPQEIAEWVYFVGVTNRFMTGQSLLIDGGEAGNAEFVWPDVTVGTKHAE